MADFRSTFFVLAFAMLISVVLTLCFYLPCSLVASAPLQDCTLQPCLNGGVCVNDTHGNVCSCANGFTGRNCGASTDVLKNEVDILAAQILANKLDIDQVFTNTMDSILSSQGPRFFTEWITVQHSDASQIRMFNMGTNRRQFLAATTTVPNHAQYGVTIYEIMPNSSLYTMQTIQVPGLNGFQTFSLGGTQYIAAACSLGGNGTLSSWLYKWSGFQFLQLQELPTNGATDVDFISTLQASFLVFSSSAQSVIYVWDPANEQFVQYQLVPFMGATRVHFATAMNTIYLALTSGGTDSAVFAYDDNSIFELLQSDISSRSRDLYPFAVGSFLFLVALNQFEGATHSHSHFNSSVVFRLSGDHFREHSKLPINGEYVHYFPVKGEHFIVVSSGGSGLVIYKLDGAGMLQFQRISAQNASFVDTFLTPDGCRVLLVSDVNGFPTLYKWASLGLIPNSCSLQ